MLVWRCECGAQFEELGRQDPGNVSGWMDAKAHVQTHRDNQEPEVLTGLWDTETGELLFRGGMRPIAVKEGILPYAKERLDGVESEGRRSPMAGKIMVREIPIDPVVYVCFLESQALFPQAYPDDRPQTISRFITECVLGMFRLMPEVFTMSKVIEAAVRGTLTVPEDTEMVPAMSDVYGASAGEDYYGEDEE